MAVLSLYLNLIWNSLGLTSVDLWTAWHTRGFEYPWFQPDLCLRYEAICNRWRQHFISMSCISFALNSSSTDSKGFNASYSFVVSNSDIGVFVCIDQMKLWNEEMCLAWCFTSYVMICYKRMLRIYVRNIWLNGARHSSTLRHHRL